MIKSSASVHMGEKAEKPNTKFGWMSEKKRNKRKKKRGINKRYWKHIVQRTSVTRDTPRYNLSKHPDFFMRAANVCGTWSVKDLASHSKMQSSIYGQRIRFQHLSVTCCLKKQKKDPEGDRMDLCWSHSRQIPADFSLSWARASCWFWGVTADMARQFRD